MEVSATKWDASGISNYTGVIAKCLSQQRERALSLMSALIGSGCTECCLEEDLRLQSHQAGKAVSVRKCGDKGGGGNCARHLPSLAQTVMKIIFSKKGGCVGNLSLRQHGEEDEIGLEQPSFPLTSLPTPSLISPMPPPPPPPPVASTQVIFSSLTSISALHFLQGAYDKPS